MNVNELWIAMSWAWSDTELDEDEMIELVNKINAKPKDIPLMYFHVIFRIIPSWSLDSFFVIPSAGTNLPWGGWIPESIVEKRHAWLTHLVLLVFLPVCWLGLPVSYILGLGFFKELRKYVRKSV